MLTFSGPDLVAIAGAFLLPFLRVAALFSSAPLLSHRAVPQRVRLAAAFAIAACVALAGPAAPVPQGAGFVLAAVEQVLVGLAIGFTMQLVFAGVALAGDLAGLQMGLGFASLFDPSSGGQSPVLGVFMQLCALLLMLSLDGHLVLVGAVARGLGELPPGALAARLDPAMLAGAGATVFATGLQLALPMLAGVLMVNLGLALVARVSPQLNLFSVGLPAALMAGIALLVVSAPAWLTGIESLLRAALAPFAR